MKCNYTNLGEGMADYSAFSLKPFGENSSLAGALICAETFYSMPGNRNHAHGFMKFFAGFDRNHKEQRLMDKILSNCEISRDKSIDRRDVASFLMHVSFGPDAVKNRFFYFASSDANACPTYAPPDGAPPMFYRMLRDTAEISLAQIKIGEYIYIEDEKPCGEWPAGYYRHRVVGKYAFKSIYAFATPVNIPKAPKTARISLTSTATVPRTLVGATSGGKRLLTKEKNGQEETIIYASCDDLDKSSGQKRKRVDSDEYKYIDSHKDEHTVSDEAKDNKDSDEEEDENSDNDSDEHTVSDEAKDNKDSDNDSDEDGDNKDSDKNSDYVVDNDGVFDAETGPDVDSAVNDSMVKDPVVKEPNIHEPVVSDSIINEPLFSERIWSRSRSV